MGSAVNIALPTIAAEFALDAVSLSLVASSYLLATASFLVPLGRCADIYGRKLVFTLDVVVFTASALLSALATSGLTLILFRFLEGIGIAMIYGTGIAMITSVFPPKSAGGCSGSTSPPSTSASPSGRCSAATSPSSSPDGASSSPTSRSASTSSTRSAVTLLGNGPTHAGSGSMSSARSSTARCSLP